MSALAVGSPLPAGLEGSFVFASSAARLVLVHWAQVKFLGGVLNRSFMLNGIRMALNPSSFMRLSTLVKSAGANKAMSTMSPLEQEAVASLVRHTKSPWSPLKAMLHALQTFFDA